MRIFLNGRTTAAKLYLVLGDVDAWRQNFITGNAEIINAVDGTNRRALTNATPTSSFTYSPAKISPDGNTLPLVKKSRLCYECGTSEFF